MAQNRKSLRNQPMQGQATSSMKKERAAACLARVNQRFGTSYSDSAELTANGTRNERKMFFDIFGTG